MTKLTDTQMSVLASACERPDGIAIRPETLNRTAAVKVAAKLLLHNFVREVPAKLGWPIWRQDEEGRGLSLKIQKAGKAIVRPAPLKGERVGKEAAAQADVKANPSSGVVLPSAASIQHGAPGRKRDLVIALLQRDSGASIADLMAATGWLPHSTRAALTGLRKAGLSIERDRDPGSQASVYRIALPAAAATA